MSTDKLDTTDDTNTAEVKKEIDASENVVTVFDLASEIEDSLKDIQEKIKDQDARFKQSVSNIEEVVEKLKG
ncbi:hypothetical protein NCAS_0B00820 [Naumovozyma castellii]|uniref:Uncharacterized protein n=1 Tax=Naumovozyma castellii TaxID=27288 RepID=G0VB43_NAUCA|nr:hypothetical protein NCAS_0B00820 [Naumovozyma castellii CBS 4309]CCC68166.1 hypothetical protein NCAS_0B00820 [Naumovozyma castellii CBS 4309]